MAPDISQLGYGAWLTMHTHQPERHQSFLHERMCARPCCAASCGLDPPGCCGIILLGLTALSSACSLSATTQFQAGHIMAQAVQLGCRRELVAMGLRQKLL